MDKFKQCLYCSEYVKQTDASILKHLRDNHTTKPSETEKISGKYACLHPNCSTSCSNISNLKRHQRKQHGLTNLTIPPPHLHSTIKPTKIKKIFPRNPNITPANVKFRIVYRGLPFCSSKTTGGRHNRLQFGNHNQGTTNLYNQSSSNHNHQKSSQLPAHTDGTGSTEQRQIQD